MMQSSLADDHLCIAAFPAYGPGSFRNDIRREDHPFKRKYQVVPLQK